MNDDRIALRMRDVARLLDLPLSSCYAAAKRGEIPVVRFGNALRVPMRDLLQCLERRIVPQGSNALSEAADSVAVQEPER